MKVCIWRFLLMLVIFYLGNKFWNYGVYVMENGNVKVELFKEISFLWNKGVIVYVEW